MRIPQRGWMVIVLAATLAIALAAERRDAPPQPAAPAPAKAAAPQPVLSDDLLAATADSRSVIAEADAARAANARLALVPGALEPAAPFSGAVAAVDRDRAEVCLAQAIHYEAGYEGEAGRRAVAQVVLNRVRHPAFPHSVCGVVFQRDGGTCQFTFACDGSLGRAAPAAQWERARREARQALSGWVESRVGMATHYHADYVYPAWAPRLDKVAVLGQHIFYRWPQGWGRRRAFTAPYAGEGQVPGIEIQPVNGRITGTFDVVPGQPAEVAPRRSDGDGGYVDPTKGWRPSISEVENEQGEAPKP